MPVNQTQIMTCMFAILTLFVASASGQQQWGANIPQYQADEAIFDTDKVSEDVSAFFKSGIEDEIKRPEDSKPVHRTASLRNRQSLVDKDGYLLGTAGGGIWSDVPAAPTAAKPTPATPTPATPAGAATPTPAATSPTPVIPASASSKSTTSPFHPPTPAGTPPAIPAGSAARQAAAADAASVVAGAQGGANLPAASSQVVSQAPILANNPASYAQITPGDSKFRLRLGFDVLLWERGQPADDIFATDDTGQQISFSDFDLTDGTARYFIQFMGDDLTGYEFTFFDFNTFSSTINASGSNFQPLFFNGLPAGGGDEFALNYNSRLKNVELNRWLRHNQVQRSGYGIRHINLDENFDVIASRGSEGLFSRVDNNLLGLTRMWERRRFWAGRLEMVGGIDAGLYINRAQIDVDTLNVDDASEDRNLAGTLGFNLGVEYQVAEQVTLRFGYEGLGIFGVALASTQSLEQELVNGLGDPELGSIFFGGFHFGATATF